MKRSTVEMMVAKAIAADGYWHSANDSAIGNFEELKSQFFSDATFFNNNYKYSKPEPEYYIPITEEQAKNMKSSEYTCDEGIDNGVHFKRNFRVHNPEWKVWHENEKNVWCKKFAKEHNLKTKADWYENSYELTGIFWYETEKDYAEYLIDAGYFETMSDEELQEEYNKKCC